MCINEHIAFTNLFITRHRLPSTSEISTGQDALRIARESEISESNQRIYNNPNGAPPHDAW
jgi:hypothetical protein